MIAPVRWTPAQAGYWACDTRITTTHGDGSGLPVHFLDTRHGVMARIFLGDINEIVLWRPANTAPTFQGWVEIVDTEAGRGWVGFDPDGEPVTAVHANYVEAEAPLLRLHTRRRSQSDLPWDRYAPPHIAA